MKLSLPSFAGWRSGALAAFTRFPWNILCGATGAACLITLIHTEHNEWLEGQCVRLAMAAAIGMPLFFSLHILRERIPKFTPWPIEIVGLFVLAGWFLVQPVSPLQLPGIIWIQWLLFLAALHCVAAVSAHFSRRESLGFWQFNRRLFIRFCLVTLYTVVLTAGLELAMLSADKLFQLELSKEYGDLFFLMVGLFQPTFFLADVPRDFAALDLEADYPRGLKAFTQFALAPLAAVYTAILYAYAIKIVVIRSWPHGWVALPVLLLSGIGILAFLLLSPLRTRPEEKWAHWFATNFPRALAPLAVLLLLSLHVRAREYGITEARYIGIVAALWIFAWAILFTVRRNAGIRWIPTSLAIIAMLCAFGPWSAGDISKMSQLKQLKHMLQAHGMWKDDHAARPDGTANFSSKESSDFENKISYLVRMHGGQSIRKIFEPIMATVDWSKLNPWDATTQSARAVRLTPSGSLYLPSEENSHLEIVKRSEASIGVTDFREACRTQVYPGGSVRCGDITISLEGGALRFSTAHDEKPKDIPMRKILNHSNIGSSEKELSTESLTLDLPEAQPMFRLIFDRITFRRDAADIRITGADFYLLEK